MQGPTVMNRSNFSDALDQSALPQPQLALFAVKDNVEYHSASYKQWMDAVVQGVSEVKGRLFYDLDVKPKAHPNRVRRRAKTQYFKVDEEVKYWSDTHQQYMGAKVIKAEQNVEGIWEYDLDIKAKANSDNIYPVPAQAPMAPENRAVVSGADAGAGAGQADLEARRQQLSYRAPQHEPPPQPQPQAHDQHPHHLTHMLPQQQEQQQQQPQHPQLPPPQRLQQPQQEQPQQQQRYLSAVVDPPPVPAHRGQSPLSGRGHTAAGHIPQVPSSNQSRNSFGGLLGGGPSAEAEAVARNPAGVSARPMPNGGTLGPIAAGAGYPTPVPAAAVVGYQLRNGEKMASVTVSSPTKVRGGCCGAMREDNASPTAAQRRAHTPQAVPAMQQPQQQVQAGRMPQASGQVLMGSAAVQAALQRGTTPPRRAVAAYPQGPQLVNGSAMPAGALLAVGGQHGGGVGPMVPATASASWPTSDRAPRVGKTAGAPSSRMAPGAGGRHINASGRPIEFGEISVGADKFDPAQPQLLQQLKQKLGLPQNATIVTMKGFTGGMNEGVWYAKCPGREDLVLKLVRCKRIAQNVLTEAENFAKLQQDLPGLIQDPMLAFPVKILSCNDRAGQKKHDLIVMKKIRGQRFAEWIGRKWYSNPSEKHQVYQKFEECGAWLAEFHANYGNSQHGDFQPSNVFYDEDLNTFCFIDIGGMCIPTTETDVEHFVRSLALLSENYGHEFAVEGRTYFERGYQRAAAGMR
mmetsp:Transcript_73689/g.239988  ORF Transcript_73689/g.239988 Transcript_73689/m.239988 type:complete len:743 (+) Transcript_73689:159-2387(+)